MLSYVLVSLIPLFFVDLFWVLYTRFKKFQLKRVNDLQRKKGFEENELSTYEELLDRKQLLIYAACTLIVIIINNILLFTGTSYLEETMFSFFKEECIGILTLYLAILTFGVLFRYAKNIILFIKGFSDGVGLFDKEK